MITSSHAGNLRYIKVVEEELQRSFHEVRHGPFSFTNGPQNGIIDVIKQYLGIDIDH